LLPGFLDANALELVTLALETVPIYNSRHEQRAVNRVLRAALGHDAFLKPLAAALIKQGSGKLPPQHAFTLLEWSCLVLEQLPPEGSKKATQKLLEVQANLLDTLYASSDMSSSSSRCRQHHWLAAQRTVLRLLRVRPTLQADYLEAAAASGSPGLVRAALAGAMQQQQRQQQDSRQQAINTLLPVLCDKVLAGREKPPASLLAAYGPLLGALELPQLTETLLPAASRAMRRTPEPAITALAAALQYVQLDLSSSALELVGLLVAQLRAKEAVRGAAGAALSAVARCVQDPAVGQQLVASVSGLLGGGSAEGKIKAAAERTALAAALTALSSLPPDSCRLAAVDAATFCSTYYKEEREQHPPLNTSVALLCFVESSSSSSWCGAASAKQRHYGMLSNMVDEPFLGQVVLSEVLLL
jgi:hypothetical protein